MESGFSFECSAQAPGSCARAGELCTPHGRIRTPVFMPVGTQAGVKAVSPRELKECGCSLILANTYHLHLRPSDTLIRDAGGLHAFEGWDGALLTDSGGFQVFSLKEISKITDEGVWFLSHIDGSPRFFSPRSVVEMQHNIGADIIMCFDECPPALAATDAVARAVERTIRWASVCNETHAATPFYFNHPQALFGIVQGGTIEALRRRCAEELVAMQFPGYAIGGCAVGETPQQMYAVVAFTAGLLPREKPRYLMGVGKPADILECIDRGVDMFDCVLPTRNGRNGSVFTSSGRINIRNAKYTRDFDHGLDDRCSCYACRNFSRSYLRHLYMAKEILAIRLFTYHNIHFFMELVRTARERILDGDFKEWKSSVLRELVRSEEEP